MARSVLWSGVVCAYTDSAIHGFRVPGSVTLRYEFAGYRFDPEMGLSLGARPIRLAPKECRLLAVLLQAQGRTLSKEDLGALVWGDVAVSDSSIFRAVYKLRQAMAAAGGPDVVETLYGTGFRMAASIRLAAETRSPTVGDLVRTPHSAAANALLSAREYGGGARPRTSRSPRVPRSGRSTSIRATSPRGR